MFFAKLKFKSSIILKKVDYKETKDKTYKYNKIKEHYFWKSPQFLKKVNYINILQYFHFKRVLVNSVLAS